MLQRPVRVTLSRAVALAAAALMLLPGTAPAIHAAELGDVAVRSHVGQQLSADIELVMLTPEELVDGVPVRLAGPNIYLGANLRMHPALSSLRMSVVKRDQRMFVHLTTFQPIDTELLHLFLELGSGSRANVRAATLWLTPEPPAAPRPAVIRSPAPMPTPLEAPAPTPKMYSEAALAAARARAAANRARDEGAAAHGAAPGATATAAATAPAEGHAAAPRKAGPVCTSAQLDERLKQCLVLDKQNVELTSKIRDLEGKVRDLQVALGGAVPTPGVAATPAVAPSAAAAASAASAVAASSVAEHGAPASAAASAAASVASASAAAASAETPAASAATSGSAAMNPAGSVIPATAASAASAASANGNGNGNGKKERRSGLNATTMLVLGGVGFLVVTGGLVHLIRTGRLKFNIDLERLKFWQRLRRKKVEPEPEPLPPQEPISGNE